MGALRSRARMNAATISSVNGATSPNIARLAKVNGTSGNGTSPSSPQPGATSPGISRATKANGTGGNGTSLSFPQSAVPSREERLQQILEMIESGKPCTIQALAEQFNLSHSRLQHLFKQQTGMSLGHLLTQQRLHRAAHLLTHSNKRIKEIAHAVGYEHASSFIRAFERHFAKAPRLFRQTENGKTG